MPGWRWGRIILAASIIINLGIIIYDMLTNPTALLITTAITLGGLASLLHPTNYKPHDYNKEAVWSTILAGA